MVALSAILARITGVPHSFDGPYLVCAEVAGEPCIDRWDESVLGPQPSEEQIATVGLMLAKELGILAAAAACDAVLDPMAARFGRWESATWKDQLSEANAILAGDANPTIAKYPHIGGIIAETGETWHDFAMAVQANNELWTPLVISAAGQRQRIVARIKACETPEAVAVVNLTIRLPG